MRLQFKSKWAHRVRSVLYRSDSSLAAKPSGPAVAPATADWDEAFSRVESYLSAHHIESRVLLNSLTTGVLKAARELAVSHPGEAPVTLAVQVAHARIGEWLVHAIGEGDWSDQRFRARGRLWLLLAEIPAQCPERFMSLDELPIDIRKRSADFRLQPVPELRQAVMPPSTLEFSLSEAVEQKWTTFHGSAFVRGSFSWIVIAGAAGLTWLITH